PKTFQNLKTSGKHPNGCFYSLFFPFAFRIVKQRKPSNFPAGRAPEPFRLETKKASQSVKGPKTFLIKDALQHQKTFRLRSPLTNCLCVFFVLLAKGEK
ncbi:MAG: hypothetical protein WAM95_21380, partial [Bacillus sp. (in: firmicutes)]